jgi:hypothetical protein
VKANRQSSIAILPGMGKRLLATALVGAGLSLGLADSASAAVWSDVGTFYNQHDCSAVGQAYVVTGRAVAYACQEKYGPPRPWLLRVLD